MSKLTERDIEILSAQTPLTLAHWWLALNKWEWPAELPDEESREEYDAILEGSGDVERPRRSQLSDWIEGRVSLKFMLRLHNSDMTDEEYEDFWKGTHEGNRAAYRRYRTRLDEEVRREFVFRQVPSAYTGG